MIAVVEFDTFREARIHKMWALATGQKLVKVEKTSNGYSVRYILSEV